MSYFSNLVDLLKKECSLIIEEESFDTYVSTYSCSGNFELSENFLKGLAEEFQTIAIIINYYTNGDLICDFNSMSPESIDDFLKISSDISDIYTIEVKITKSFNTGVLIVYSVDLFLAYLGKTKLHTILETFSGLMQNDCFNIELYDSEELQRGFSYSRSRLIALRDEFCNFDNSSKIKLVPEDFAYRKSFNTNLVKVLTRYRNILSYIYLFNITKIEDNNLFATLNGYKKKENNSISIDQIDVDDDRVFHIYQWVYEGVAVDERIQITRNIISINFKSNIFEIDIDTLPSIKSNYSMLAIRNTRDYLDMKSQLENQLWNSKQTIKSLINDTQSSFYACLIIMLTLLFTVVITGALSNDKALLFSKEVKLVCWLFEAIFVLFLIVKSISESNEINNLKEEYEKSIIRYKNLLDRKEFEIYSSFKSEIKFELVSSVRILWGFIALFVLVLLLHISGVF